jgi:hypothetical protein
MRWAGNVAFMAEMRGAHSVVVVKPEGQRLLQDLSIDGRIILK